MADDEYRHRRVTVMVDTIEPAEWDMDSHQIPEAWRQQAARAFKMMPFSPRDRIVGGARVREFEGFDLIFIVTREADTLVVTIGGVETISPEGTTEKLLAKADLVATLRSASGV